MKSADKIPVTIVVDRELWEQLVSQGVVTLHEDEELSFDLELLHFTIRGKEGSDKIEIIDPYTLEDTRYTRPEQSPPPLRIVSER